MTEPENYSFRRYLDAKRTVDRRARDRRVLEAFQSSLQGFEDPVDVCEIGTGTGPMVERVREWTEGADVRYTALDADSDLVDVAADRLATRGERMDVSGDHPDHRVRVGGESRRFEAEFVVADALEFLRDADREYDVLVGQAFLDLTDVRRAVATVSTALRPGGVGYFPITFDGVTALCPVVEPELDERIERRFHRHMDRAEKDGDHTGDSNAGRHLLTAVPETGGEIVAAGGSDWVVSSADGEYEADEAYFLHHLVDTIAGALADDEAIDDGRLADWAETRHGQVESADLVYVAHQLDVLARWPGDD